MRKQSLILATVGALAAGGVAACDGTPSDAGDPLTGTFVLRQANDAPLPLVIWASATERYELVGEVLHFERGGGVLRERTIRQSHPGTGRDTTHAHAFRQQYRRHGTWLMVGRTSPCPPNARCLPNDTGTVDGDRIELESWLYGTGPQAPRLVYVRE